MGDILSLQESVQVFQDIAYIFPTVFFLQNTYAIKGLDKEFTLSGYLLPFYKLMKLVVVAKGTFKLPQNRQAGKIFDLDCMKLYLGTF